MVTEVATSFFPVEKAAVFVSLPAAEVERMVMEAAYMSVVARIFRREVVASRLTELIKAICNFHFSDVWRDHT